MVGGSNSQPLHSKSRTLTTTPQSHLRKSKFKTRSHFRALIITYPSKSNKSHKRGPGFKPHCSHCQLHISCSNTVLSSNHIITNEFMLLYQCQNINKTRKIKKNHKSRHGIELPTLGFRIACSTIRPQSHLGKTKFKT